MPNCVPPNGEKGWGSAEKGWGRSEERRQERKILGESRGREVGSCGEPGLRKELGSAQGGGEQWLERRIQVTEGLQSQVGVWLGGHCQV